MTHTTLTARDTFLDDIAGLARKHLARAGDDAPITRFLNEDCLDELTKHFPYLGILATRVELAQRADRVAAPSRPYDPMTMPDYPISDATRLAEAAYEAAVRAAVLGHRHPAPTNR